MSEDIGAWSDVHLDDLLLAYRKSKADCFYERSSYVTERFSLYEEDLVENLMRILRALREGRAGQLLKESLGHPRIFAKKLSLESRADADLSHSFFSDTDRAFERLNDANQLIPEFRIVGDFPVDMHVLSALWVNTVGHKFDSKLRNTAYGSRLRRYRDDFDSAGRPNGAYHREAIGSFEPYFRPYKAWRDDGMRAIKTALDDGQTVVALTLDFSSYYHNIDPRFMTNGLYLECISLDLNDWEIEFTNIFVDALVDWSKGAGELLVDDDLLSEKRGGLPIGLSAVRIITNALLIELDEVVKNQLNPIYYGRYVDDIFLVLNDPGHIKTSAELWNYIRYRAGIFNFSGPGSSEVSVELPGGYQGETRLVFQTAKQKLFFLGGQSGLDLLDSIAHQIRSLSSERRLMPLPEELEVSASARVLAASETTANDPDSLRRADGLTIRRLGWALQLRSVEILGRDLSSESWIDARRKFYKFARAHILRPDKILEQLDYLPRLVSLAISLSDWEDAGDLLTSALNALERLRAAVDGGACKINGVRLSTARHELWDDLSSWVVASCKDAAVRSFPWDAAAGMPLPISISARRVLDLLGLAENIHQLALAAREADLAKTPYKEHLRYDAYVPRPPSVDEEVLAVSYQYSNDLREFLARSNGEEVRSGVRRVHARCEDEPQSVLPFLVPTRPYTAQEVALYLPDACVFGGVAETSREWARYLRAVRGIWSQANWGDPQQVDWRTVSAHGEIDSDVAVVGGRERELRLGITSLLTEDSSWAVGAAGRPDLSPARYKRLATIVNLAIRADPQPTHLLLPELCLPERWLATISGMLLDANISLIAGLDYDHYAANTVGSSAVLVLTDDRLGYPSAIQIRQPKVLPAPGEEENLYVSYGKTWRDWGVVRKPIYIHNGFHFGILVCSELQNISYRERYQGRVDWLGVLSWNRDLDTFSSLIESASLDVHAYVALVNNRHYGDSRVRSPSKENYSRDVCRIRGGLNEHLVVVRIDPSELRAQQSRAFRWSRPYDKYKPAPEGFVLAPSRRVTPS